MVCLGDKQQPGRGDATNENLDGDSIGLRFPKWLPRKYHNHETEPNCNYFRDYESRIRGNA
jgi:hypothetical protein